MDLGDALAWLDGHQNLERILANQRTGPPSPARMHALADVAGNPQSAAPVIQITGTNGKTSTARAVTALLMAKGLTVGTFTSPHLEAINERISVDGEPIADDDLAAVLSDLAALESLLPERPNWFELMTAAALRWFADRPVDVVVLEVGLGGRWDATNVADATVAVVTNIGLDHVELLGPTRGHIAGEKAGIVKPGTVLVLGERDPDLLAIFEAESPESLLWAGRDWEVTRNDLAVGGRVLDIRTPGATYSGVWLDLHGRHQVDNFAAALVAVEAFFGTHVETRFVRDAAAALRSPGRLEVMGRHPLVVLDGAKNVEGARAAARAIDEEVGAEAVRSRILVVGMLAGKDPVEMLDALDATASRLVITCPPPSPRAQSAATVAAAMRTLLAGRPPSASPGPAAEVVEAETVTDAIELALGAAGPDDLVLITGSLYVVGAARSVLRSGRFSAR